MHLPFKIRVGGTPRLSFIATSSLVLIGNGRCLKVHLDPECDWCELGCILPRHDHHGNYSHTFEISMCH